MNLNFPYGLIIFLLSFVKFKNRVKKLKGILQPIAFVRNICKDKSNDNWGIDIKLNSELKNRKDFHPPDVIEKWGWKYHHLGIPTTKKMPNEKYLEKFKMYVSGFEESPFGIEWIRFEKDSPMSKIIQTVPHLAFEVENLDYELSKRNLNIITEPNYPTNGIKVAMIEYNGAPIELIEFEKKTK